MDQVAELFERRTGSRSACGWVDERSEETPSVPRHAGARAQASARRRRMPALHVCAGVDERSEETPSSRQLLLLVCAVGGVDERSEETPSVPRHAGARARD